LEGGLDIASVEALSALDPKAFYRYIAGVLPLSVGVDLVFGGIIGKLNRLSSQWDW